MAATTGNKELTRDLFNKIAPHYDFVNSLASFGRHHYWRRTLIELSGVFPGASVLDVCCGTGMITFELAQKTGCAGKVIGVDFAEGMLRFARGKRDYLRFRDRIELITADALDLPFADDTFDCAVIGYGLRNVTDLRRALLEIKRVLKPGGKLASLELAHPNPPVFKDIYYFYLNHWIPLLGKLFAGNRSAYLYLNKSVREYPHQRRITQIFEELGFLNTQCLELTWGIAAIHVGTKPMFNNIKG
ncbi:MAG: bifunctional demethylmenaquinone methyltransferase/2-methoxy-6-polyprenyl-1,4-benzoquinol methylase UbiE [Firmicutes bacterium]|nr:bifunctional demethylmenaquinone methyltransferase/2-methoxy-6-polyprenyl-1,4-benzoquinol methylase UbiE [Bacillota bacterium]